ncbi:hypothetical protein [Almyronema epifaneia]|uniref:Uncharacterized protein n=1 Tax=Almyronema epifaneia S1 TaxID=2991925 RepID=A0ABW6IIA2_9CYAN
MLLSGSRRLINPSQANSTFSVDPIGRQQQRLTPERIYENWRSPVTFILMFLAFNEPDFSQQKIAIACLKLNYISV